MFYLHHGSLQNLTLCVLITLVKTGVQSVCHVLSLELAYITLDNAGALTQSWVALQGSQFGGHGVVCYIK